MAEHIQFKIIKASPLFLGIKVLCLISSPSTSQRV